MDFDTIAGFGRWIQAHPHLTLWTMGGAAGLAGLMHLLKAKPAEDTHGSARWATKREAQRAALHAETGVVLGKHAGHILRHDGPEHILLIGPTRSGKGISTIIPTLLEWPESVLVLDPKDGENYDVTARWRAEMSQVYAFTPCREAHACINVFDTIRLGEAQEVGDAQRIAQSLTAPHKLGHEGATSLHFRELASLLLTAAILHVCHVERRKSLAGVWDFLTQQHASLQDALKAMRKTANKVEGVHTAITSMTRAIENITGDRELSSVWTTAIRPLTLYNDPLVAQSTDTSHFVFDQLQYGGCPVSLYLIAPSPLALERLHPVFRVILDVGMERLMDHKVRTWQYRLLNILDELPWHGYTRAVDKGIAVKAGYGIKDLVVTQDLPALLETFGETTAILGNCRIKVIHTPDNDVTAKRISENLLGDQTVESTSTSSSSGHNPSQSTSVQPTRRPLLTTSEVMDLPADKEIVRIGGIKPIFADKVDYRTEPAWRGRWTPEAQHKEATHE